MNETFMNLRRLFVKLFGMTQVYCHTFFEKTNVICEGKTEPRYDDNGAGRRATGEDLRCNGVRRRATN